MVSLLYIRGSVLDADGKGGVTRRQSMVTERGNTCRRGMTRVNARGGKEGGRKKPSTWNGFSLLGRSICILLLRLASFGATSRPLSRLGRWSGLGFPASSCIFSGIGGTRRSSPAVDSGVRTFVVVVVDFGNVLIVSKLLVQKSGGGAICRSVCAGKSIKGR